VIFPLNEQQRRHLGVALDRLDVALLEVISCSGGDIGRQAAPRLLRPEQLDIPATVAPRLLAAALMLRGRLGADLARLEVRATPESARRRAAAYLMSALVLLEDCHSPSMAAYGDVDPALPSVLDPWLSDLEAGVDALRRLLAGVTDDGVAD